jgi:hypothetical protein
MTFDEREQRAKVFGSVYDDHLRTESDTADLVHMILAPSI